jgi:hypothetical protein
MLPLSTWHSANKVVVALLNINIMLHLTPCKALTWAAMCMAIALICQCDVIHQLEADTPLLSWFLPTWVKNIHHFRTFEEQHKDSEVVDGETASLVDIVKNRFDTHYDPVRAAAYLVDTMFTQEGAQGWFSSRTGTCLAQTNRMMRWLS